MRRVAHFRMPAALLAASLVAAPGSAAERWTEIRTRHFHVVANASAGEARRIVLRLERFRAVVDRVFPDLPLDDRVPLTVLLFKDSRSLKPFYPRQDGKIRPIAGMFVDGHDRNYMVLDASDRTGAFETPLHEYLHALNSRARPEPMPLWMNEGLAELYSNVELDDDRVVIGRPRVDHLTLLRGRRVLPIQEVLAADAASPAYQRSEKRDVFYAQAWALVHYLLLGSAGEPRPLRAYMLELAKGSAPAEAARQAWGLESAALEKEIVRYLRAWRFKTLRIDLDPLAAAELRESLLREAQAEFYKGDFLVHDNRFADARPHLERAIALEPALPDPYRSLGLGHYYANDLHEALRWFDAAIQRDPADGVARYFRARATLQAAGPLVGPATAAFVREDLRIAGERTASFDDAGDLLAHMEKVLGSSRER